MSEESDRLTHNFSIEFRDAAIEAFRNEVAALQSENEQLRAALLAQGQWKMGDGRPYARD